MADSDPYMIPEVALNHFDGTIRAMNTFGKSTLIERMQDATLLRNSRSVYHYPRISQHILTKKNLRFNTNLKDVILRLSRSYQVLPTNMGSRNITSEHNKLTKTKQALMVAQSEQAPGSKA